MPINEKEYNGNLFDQLSILERIEAVTDDEKALKQIAIERRQIERKLYQKPPLIDRYEQCSNKEDISKMVSFFN